ncbi:dehydrodolichyl diphosphate synthase complex subunit nus1 isoform X2 [Folsomia candida]|uniref:dehydrodolichyl diphosphate synthase complex subunit nus1 isoform X2 n=1 Tax=Folsomia candida TaxID=158441 RepID=UPI000B909B5B|nr:dehydrodolichyl diphosphate synthase complex subunit nus1 isoform X2 [Folsomia candida]
MTMFSRVTSLVLGLLYVLVHFLYHILSHIVDEVGWNVRQICNRLLTCLPAHSTHGQLASIFHTLRRLRADKRKTPTHLGVVVFPREHLGPLETLLTNLKGVVRKWGHHNSETQLSPSHADLPAGQPPAHVVDLQALAKVVSYAWIADIPIVSLYDHSGYIKSNYKQLIHYVQEEISHNLWVVQERTVLLPKINIHNVVVHDKRSNNNGYINNGHSMNGVMKNGNLPLNDQEILNVCIFGSDDGKKAIIQTCKDLYHEFVHSNSSSNNISQKIKEMDERVVDANINCSVNLKFISSDDGRTLKSEPDLLIALGKVVSTTGFLPWQIRLTEMHWLPPLKRFGERDFLQCMLKYANCHQRFGT